MTLDELNQLRKLLHRLDSEARSVPDDMLQQLASEAQGAASELWGEWESRNEGRSEYEPAS